MPSHTLFALLSPKDQWIPDASTATLSVLPSRLGLSEPQPGLSSLPSPSSRTRPTTTCSAVSMQRLGSSHPQPTPPNNKNNTCAPYCMHAYCICMHESTRCWGLLFARPHGTAITPLHSPEIVGQIFRDLSATACLSAPPNLEEKWIGSARLDPGPAQPQPGSCPQLPSLLVTDHTRG